MYATEPSFFIVLPWKNHQALAREGHAPTESIQAARYL